jgi:hypothetical protein
VTVCYQCRETVRPSECRWIWITAGGLTAVQYVCSDCEYVAGLLGLLREEAVL